MNDVEMSQYLTERFEGVEVLVAAGDSFFFYHPDQEVAPDYRFPFVTLVTSDSNDPFSDLKRPGIFRLNIGVSKQTFQTLFDDPAALPSVSEADGGKIASDYDFTALDRLMPHPVYGRLSWVCILNPSDETLQTQVQPLLLEAYQMAVQKYTKRSAHE